MSEPVRSEARAEDAPREQSSSRVATLEHELALAREIRKRLDAEMRRLETRVAALETEAGHLRGVLSERERYLNAIQGSFVWRSAQALRRVAGRAW